MRGPLRRRGFTLLEVLVALLVVALALVALMRTAGSGVRQLDALRERTLAGWVAANVLTETRLAAALPDTGRSDGEARLGGREWRWRRDIQATPVATVRRIRIEVRLAGSDAPSAHLEGFSGSALEP